MTEERIRELESFEFKWERSAMQVLQTDGKPSHITAKRFRELESKLSLLVARKLTSLAINFR
jgi:hypothetical protein